MRSSTLRYGLLAVLLLGFGAAEWGCVGELGRPLGVKAADDPEPVVEEPEPSSAGNSLFFYYGPMKLMYGEAILHSIEAITGHKFGSWDSTRPDPASDAFVESGNGDGAYYRHCRLLGGCMEHRIPLPRTSFVGTAYVLEMEKSITTACFDREVFGMFPGAKAPEADLSANDIIEHQYLQTFSIAPTKKEMALAMTYFQSHMKQPELDDISALESAGRGHCRAILGTNRFLFY